MQAQNAGEKVLSILYMLFNIALTAHLICSMAALIFHGSIRTFSKVIKKVDHVAAGRCCIHMFMNSAKMHFDEGLSERATKGTRRETASDELFEEQLFVTIQIDVVRSFDDAEYHRRRRLGSGTVADLLLCCSCIVIASFFDIVFCVRGFAQSVNVTRTEHSTALSIHVK